MRKKPVFSFFCFATLLTAVPLDVVVAFPFVFQRHGKRSSFQRSSIHETSLQLRPFLFRPAAGKTLSLRTVSSLNMAKIGIFFGTSTGNTETTAEMIKAEFGSNAEGPFEIDSIQGSVATKFAQCDALIVGTPTWNTGAETERSGTGWDEIYYNEMQDLDIVGKMVAVFGLGDSVSYAENYADATGELHDVFEKLGCKMMGYTSQEGYEHIDSKSIRGDKFCGLLIDAINQEDLTEGRVKNWVAQLIDEGILDSAATTQNDPISATSTPTIASHDIPPVPVHVDSSSFPPDETAELIEKLKSENAKLQKMLNEKMYMEKGDAVNGSTTIGEYTPHYNAKKRRTMWISQDGRTCYYTT